MIILIVLAAIFIAFGLHHTKKPPRMPSPVTPSNLDQALRHISQTYGHNFDGDHHDEADGPAPVLIKKPILKRYKNKENQSVLANALRIPARLAYTRGHHVGEPRDVIILGALGTHGQDGELNVECIRCLCTKVTQFRMFRLEFISELIDGETGAIVPDIKLWLDHKLAALV